VFRAKIRVTLRRSILDPQGKAVEHAIASLGEEAIQSVRIGKYVEMEVHSGSVDEARQTTERVCRKLLANPVMEDYHFEIEKADHG
jgi:phosphoribosylformylglycinamidine synthase subunit PurS